MGVIQNSINQIVGSTTAAAGIAKIADDKPKRLAAENDYLQGMSNIDTERGTLNKKAADSDIEVAKQQKAVDIANDNLEVAEGLVQKDDPEGQKWLRELGQAQKKAQASLEVALQENEYTKNAVQNRLKYLDAMERTATERANVYKVDTKTLREKLGLKPLEKEKGGKK